MEGVEEVGGMVVSEPFFPFMIVGYSGVLCIEFWV